MQKEKASLIDFWNKNSCGESLYLTSLDIKGYEEQANQRYKLEPYIANFAGFKNVKGKRVLEIGVGLGADHQRFAENGADLYGIDLTTRAILHTQQRLKLNGFELKLCVGDAENLCFPDELFDCIYSWGVLHHSPNTLKAISEVYRVLKKNGTANIMIYHKWSLIGYMLWLRYALLTMKPWRNLKTIYANYLESPGTKAYSIKEVYRMFSSFCVVTVRTVLTHGDLLESEAGQRHNGLLLYFARKLWPRSFLRRFFSKHGLFMLIQAKK